MAYAILKALGCDGDMGSVTLDMRTDKAEAKNGHKVRACKDGNVEVESTRYPFQFVNPPTDARGQRAGLDAVPFNADLNRFTLVVKNAPSNRVRVTWGQTSKEYDAATLAQGINLAAEFGGDDNPFHDAFLRVNAAVGAQQEFETPLTKRWLHDQPTREEQTPAIAEEWQKIIDRGLEIDKLMREAAGDAVAPVRHTITIEAAQ